MGGKGCQRRPSRKRPRLPKRLEGGGKDSSRREGRSQRGREKGGGQEGECPATFGPIITDTAIPIEKGKFAIQPTFGMSFVTNSLTQSWRRVPPAAISSPSAWIGNSLTAFATTWRSSWWSPLPTTGPVVSRNRDRIGSAPPVSGDWRSQPDLQIPPGGRNGG